MKYLWDAWKDIRERIQEAQEVFLFFDYDGTLTPIVSRPELALCPPEIKDLLGRLGHTPRVWVAIISGRTLEDLYARIGVPGITYVGNHGLEIRNPAGIHKKYLSVGRQKELARIAKSLKTTLGNLPGILFEDKESILAVHYRLVPKACHANVFQEMDEVAKKWGSQWRVTRGKRVFEIQPRVDFHKGKTVRNLLKTAPAPGLLPFYFGDDQTDESAFHFLKGKGITVFVGSSGTPSGAEYFLDSPAGVAEFLKQFIAAWPPENPGASESGLAGRNS